MTLAGADVRVGPRTARFLDQPLPVVVGTVRASGIAKLTPVWFEYAGGRFWLNGWRGAVWLDQLLVQERASLLLIDPADMHRVVQVDADLVCATTDGARAALDRLAQRYLGHDYRSPVPRTRVLVELEPLRIVSSID